MIFLNSFDFCDVSSGVGLFPYVGNGCVYGLIWERRGFLGCIKNHAPYYLHSNGWRTVQNKYILPITGGMYVCK
jgi:hypothetical protein